MAGEVVDAGHPRQRAVLAVLLLDLGHAIPAELLIDRVWGEDPPGSVRNVLYGYVARLRAVVAGAADPDVTLARSHGGYLLQARPEQVDAYRFRRLVAEAAQASGDDERSAVLLRQALALWRGPALGGTESSWLQAMRRMLGSERLTAELDLNEIRLRLGEHDALAGELASQAAATPTDERLTSQLMLALWRSGRAAEALRCFELTKSHLAHELDVDPGPQLRALHEQILRGDDSLAWPGQGRRHLVSVPRELPADVPAFTGRVAELGQLDRLLIPAGDRDTSRMTTAAAARTRVKAAVISAVSGTAGVGKTALALRWAHRTTGLFPDGQLYADLHGYDAVQPLSPADVLAGFLRALGVDGADVPSSQDERAARYRSLLANRRMLIVLDNVSTVEQVRPLLPGTLSCAIIVTSRDSLAGLVARDGAARLELDLLPLADAVSLLRTLIGPRAEDDGGAAAELALQCARLPLALRVAAELAARRQVALAGLVAELGDQRRRLDLLDAGGDPHTAVRVVFSWSYRNLPADAARAFRLIGLHPGTNLDSYAVAALTGTSQDQAAQLVDTLIRAHLLQSAGPARYALHDLLRSYARELAAEDGPDGEHQALTRLLDHYLYMAATAMDVFLPGERHRRPRIPAPPTPVPTLTDPSAARRWLDGERTTLVVLITCTARDAWPSHAARLAITLFRYFDYGGQHAEAAVIHDVASRAARQAGDLVAEAEALNNLGVAELRQGRHQQAAEQHHRALALARQAGYAAGEARALGNLGLVHFHQGSYATAADRYRQALTAFRQTGDREGAANVLGNLAVIDQRRGDYRQAADYLQQALKLFGETGNRDGEASALGVLADLDQRQDRPQQAAGHLRQALTVFRETGNRDGEASALDSLADIEQRQGHYQQAAGYLQQALKLFRETGNQDGEAVALNGLGKAFLAAGQRDSALAHHAAALGIADQIGHAHEQARAHDGLGQVHSAAGDMPQARHHWQQSLILYTALDIPEASQIRARLAAETG